MKNNHIVPFVLLIGLTSAALLSTGCGVRKPGDDVAAAVDGRKIYRTDIEKYYQNQTAGSDQQPVGEQATSLRLSLLNQLIDNEILMRRAEKLGLLATDDEVERKLNEIKSPYTKEEFDARLKEKKISLEDFKRDLRRSLTVDKVLNKEVTSKINITDQDVSNYYNEHKAEFNIIEPQYHLTQIVVTTAPGQVHNLKNDKAQNEADARKKIQMLVNRLDSGDDFATLAMNYSEDNDTAGNGGDLGFTPESSLKNMDPVTRDAVSRLKPGEDSPIIPVINPIAGARRSRGPAPAWAPGRGAAGARGRPRRRPRPPRARGRQRRGSRGVTRCRTAGRGRREPGSPRARGRARAAPWPGTPPRRSRRRP